MAKNKLKKFSQIKGYPHVIEPSIDNLQKKELDLKGKWRTDFFKNNNPIILELGCGKGEYSVALAEKNPDKNFIGIDIKGARIWKGATDVVEKKISNVGFLRIRIEWIEKCFAKNEINEIWITFPDPQVKYRRSSKRLTHPLFLRRYNNILKLNGLIHLKTDSQFLHGFTLGVIASESHKVEYTSNDIYNSQFQCENIKIKTHYENIYLQKSIPITYLIFRLNY